MKKNITIFLTLVLLSFLWANAVIVEWKAEPEQDKIILQWKTSLEEDVLKFVVERSIDNSHFTDIGQVSPRGPGFQYRFEDDQLGKINGVFYYRLKIVNVDNSIQHTETLPVIPNISNISQTWGSIKALFR